ncbi:MAG TPA: MraY family glycosyltransferase [Candidatus Deferrimicrobiaceae bacterium]|jgi:UDP-GlcNAc:undecaprenyl-phosphate GlcNAc-1-phosphate transferase
MQIPITNDPAVYREAALLFFVSLLVSLFITPRTAWLARFLGAVDSPDHARKIHSRAIPRLGGMAIAAALLGALLMARHGSWTLIAFGAGAVAVVAVGFLDDLYILRPVVKFLGQVIAATLFVRLGGFELESVGNLFGFGPIETGIFAPAFTVFCMVGVMNALNLSDGLDGLAGGIAAIACVFFGLFALLSRDGDGLLVSVALLGALIGFLRYNTFPARLFMGDSGSLLLGYSLACLAVAGVHPGGAVPLDPVTVAGVLALPILDTLLVMARRFWHRQNPFLPDKTHLHHRLLTLGLPHGAVVPVLYGAMASFGLISWAMREQPEPLQLLAILAFGGAIYGTVFLAQRLHWRRNAADAGFGTRGAGGKTTAWIAVVMGKTVPCMSWVIALGLLLPALAVFGVPGRAGVVAFGIAAFMMALFPWRSQRVDSGICFGIIYVACVCLLGILHFLPSAPVWLDNYLSALCGIVLIWVLSIMKLQAGHKKIMLISGFEALLIGVTIFVPTVLVPAVGMGENVRNALLMACLESIPLLLALKILVRKQPRRNFVIATSLLAALVSLGLKGL